MKKTFNEPQILVHTLVVDEIMLGLNSGGSGNFLDVYDNDGLDAIKD